MALFDKISNLTKSAVDKTNEMIETTKLSAKVNSENSKIAVLKNRIGEYYWTQFENGSVLDAEVMEFCAEIKTIAAGIEAINAEIQALKDSKAAPVPAAVKEGKACASCGNIIPLGKKFCPECGAPMPVEEAQPAAAAKFCPSCGVQMDADKKFCSECGYKID